MSMIIESLAKSCANAERSARRGRRLRIPAEIVRAFAGHRIQGTGRVTRPLEFLERLTAHRRVDVQVRHAGDGTELLQHEEDDTVVKQPAPVAAANEIALLVGQAR